MSEVAVIIRSDGTIVVLDIEELTFFKNMGPVTTRRASHVEPDNFILRQVFHLLRRFLGDKGRMSEFTRRWPILWRANLSPIGGPVLPYRTYNRLKAIEAEKEWLNQNLV